jgi:protein-S-isoprenylcysteine O-methyltransferase Ste14
MQPLVLRDVAARSALQALVSAWFVGEYLLQRRVRRQSPQRSDWTYHAVVGAVLAAFAAAFGVARLPTAIGGGWWLVGAGLGLLVVGVALRLWAMVVLGRFFTFRVSIQEGHRVVTGGPYRLVRHPGYTGLLLACLGLGIALANWLSLAVLALLPLAAIVVRIRVEERELLGALGDDYRAFAAGKARLLPFVW